MEEDYAIPKPNEIDASRFGGSKSKAFVYLSIESLKEQVGELVPINSDGSDGAIDAWAASPDARTVSEAEYVESSNYLL